jgi:hypothetical protein
MISVKIEPFSVFKENISLQKEQWDEIALNDWAKRQMDVDYDLFELFEKAGQLATIIARENEKVVGYALFIIQKDFHAKNTLCAHSDLIFLSKEHRKGRAGVVFIKECMKILGDLFPNIFVRWHVTEMRDFGKVLTKLGCKKFETIYAIRAGV